jgi:hypothetical protein
VDSRGFITTNNNIKPDSPLAIVDRRGAGADEANARRHEAEARAKAEAKKAKDQWRIENPLEAIAELEAEVEEITKKYDKLLMILFLFSYFIIPTIVLLLFFAFL